MNNCQRLVQTFMQERCAQCGMRIDGLMPCALEQSNIEITVQIGDYVGNVYIRMLILKAVEKHSGLHGRGLPGILNAFKRHKTNTPALSKTQ